MKTAFFKLCQRFNVDRSGAIALMFAITAPVVFLIMGSGVDFGRTFMIKNKLHQSIDAAALAGASMPAGTPEAARTANIQKYFALNFPNPYLGVSVDPANLNITYAPNGDDPSSINVQIPQQVDTAFLRFANINELNAGAESEVVVNGATTTTDLDVVLIIDKTGSMGSQRQTMKDALNGFVDELLANVPDKEKVRLSFVYYDTSASVSLPWTDLNSEALIRQKINAYTTGGATNGGAGAEEGRLQILSNLPPRPSDGLTGDVKAFVFMTDGAFNTPSKSESETLFLAECNTVKNQNILAYTVAFRTTSNETLLKTCASDPDSDYHSYASTSSDLINIFTSIGGELSGLRISK